jgi:hypothetical protein
MSVNQLIVGHQVRINRFSEVDYFRIFYLAEFKGQHDGYANSICWLKGSYYLPTEESMLAMIK